MSGNGTPRARRKTLDDVATLALRQELEQALEISQARAAAAISHVAALLAIFRRIGGFITSEDQATLRAAMAWVVESKG